MLDVLVTLFLLSSASLGMITQMEILVRENPYKDLPKDKKKPRHTGA